MANGAVAAARAVILRSPGDSEAPVTPSSSSRGTIPRPHDGAVVVGAAHHDTAQHGVEVLVAVTDELRVMPGPAVDPRPAVPGVGGQ